MATTHGAAVSHARGYALRAAASSKGNERRSKTPLRGKEPICIFCAHRLKVHPSFEGRGRVGPLCGRGKFCRAVQAPDRPAQVRGQAA